MVHDLSLVKQSSLDAVKDLRATYQASLSGPLEPYIEELISYSGSTYLIRSDVEPIGYCCISHKKVLLQFHVRPDRMGCAQEAFSHLVSQSLIEKALVITRDPLCLSRAMDLCKSLSVRCHLFDDGVDLPKPLPEFADTTFRAAVAGDIPVIRAACGDFHDFLHYTLLGSIEQGEIFVLFRGSEVLGTGVISGRNSQYPHVDIGMCVNAAHRLRGVGTHIVVKLREHCRRKGWIPGASCQSTNLASKKTLEKAGMVARDRVLEVLLQTGHL